MSLVEQFLTQVRQHVRDQRGDLLRAWLQVEPNAPQPYHDMAAELRRSFPDAQSIDAIVEAMMPQDDDDDIPEGKATVWPSFQAFVKEYLALWRDVDHNDLPDAFTLLSALVNSCATAFTHPQYGAMLLDLCMSLSETLARFTLRLHQRPNLARFLRNRDEDGVRKSVAESSAEIIQKFFKACLMDRASGRKPEGKKVGVYMFANLVLKLLFTCRKTNLASMIFRNMSASSPPLHLYPAAQRVTYLYYLGRFNYAVSHYLRAVLCLEQAYLQTPPNFVSHRTSILTFLIPCNMLLGRFPSARLLARPETQPLKHIYMPLCQAIRAGNFLDFHDRLKPHFEWLWDKGLYIQLCYRLRPLLWRSLIRKTFLLTYVPPADASSRKAATLDLADLLSVAVYVQRRLEGWLPASQVDPSNAPPDTTLVPPPGGPKKLDWNEGLVAGSATVRLQDIEMRVATLIGQGFMHGFVAHGQGRFAIIGAKAKGPVVAGWPSPWQAITDRRYDEPYDPEEVPGWVRA